jgi:hypothetical protein
LTATICEARRRIARRVEDEEITRIEWCNSGGKSSKIRYEFVRKKDGDWQ